MGSLFEGYDSVAYDEMFAANGAPHPHTKALHDALQLLSSADLDERVAVLDRSLRDQGITFSRAGQEWIFPLDLIPRLIPAAEWELIESGVIQRVRALEAFLADIYGSRTVLADGIMPHALVSTSTNFCRAAVGLEPANGVRVHIAGIDLVRDGEGTIRVLEDNVRVPSGISYVVENRRTMARVFPGLFLEQQVQPVAGHVARLLAALRSAAPAGVEDPTVVLLTPGVFNSAYFEHAFLARKMGIELVEGRDLFCRDNVLYMRTTSGERRVHVLYRRVDDDYLDPVHFRSDSVVGCPGVLNAARAGNVTIANAVGNGVADDKLVYTYVPALIEYYLGEEPHPAQRAHLPAGGARRPARVPGPTGRTGAQARGRLGRLRPADRAAGQRRGTGRDASGGRGQSAGLDRPGGGDAVDLALARRRPPGAPARRPAPVRDQRRRSGAGAAGRADPGGAARGQPGRQLQPGRRVEGHLGADLAARAPARARLAGAAARAGGAGQRARRRPALGSAPAATTGRLAMLSRVAEALFWVGRYVERAEDTARLLDVHFHQVIEDPAIDESETCRVLAAVMGVEDDTPQDIRATLETLGYDAGNPSAIVGALLAARQNARGVRESLSGDIWECLNTTHHELPQRVGAARAFGPAPFFSYVRQRAAMLSGYADATMSRDHGYDFLVLGRSVERVDMTARLLAATVSRASPEEGWIATLRACSAHEAYLRTYQRGVESRLVLEFLLLDRLFPRSVFHSLVVGEEALTRLDPGAGRIGAGNDARRAIGRTRTELEFLPTELIFEDLPERLHQLQMVMSEVSDAVSRRFFGSSATVGWSLEESTR